MTELRSGRGRAHGIGLLLAAMLCLSACQSASGPGAGDGGAVLTSSRWGGHGKRLRPLDLTLAPGVPFGGCLVVENVKLGDAEAGPGLVC